MSPCLQVFVSESQLILSVIWKYPMAEHHRNFPLLERVVSITQAPLRCLVGELQIWNPLNRFH